MSARGNQVVACPNTQSPRVICLVSQNLRRHPLPPSVPTPTPLTLSSLSPYLPFLLPSSGSPPTPTTARCFHPFSFLYHLSSTSPLFLHPSSLHYPFLTYPSPPPSLSTPRIILSHLLSPFHFPFLTYRSPQSSLTYSHTQNLHPIPSSSIPSCCWLSLKAPI